MVTSSTIGTYESLTIEYSKLCAVIKMKPKHDISVHKVHPSSASTDCILTIVI